MGWWSNFWRRWKPGGSLGRRGESAAAEHLRSLGMQILAAGVRYPCGELDLVALDGQTVVFVEVKTRQSGRRGSPAEAVDRKKQSRMTRAALVYLKKHGLLNQRTRFDVVAILWPPEAAQPQIEHIRSAFESRDCDGMFS